MVWNEENLIRKTALTVKLPRGVVFSFLVYCLLLSAARRYITRLSFLQSECLAGVYPNKFHLPRRVRGGGGGGIEGKNVLTRIGNARERHLIFVLNIFLYTRKNNT